MSGRSRTFAYYSEGMCSVRNPDNCSTLGLPALPAVAAPVLFVVLHVSSRGDLPTSEPRASRDFALVTSPSRIFAYYLRAPVTGGGLTARAPWEAPTLQSGPRGNIALFIPPV